MEPLDQPSISKNNRFRVIRFVTALIALNFLATMTVLGTGMIQHYLHVRFGDTRSFGWNEHGFPFSYYHETTFNEDGLQGTNIENFLLDYLMFLALFSLLYFAFRKLSRR